MFLYILRKGIEDRILGKVLLENKLLGVSQKGIHSIILSWKSS